MIYRIKKYFENMTIRGKIQTYILAFLMILMTTLWVIQVVFFNSIYKLVKRQEATEVAQMMVQVINGEQRIERLVEEVAEKEVCIVVFNSDMQQIQSLDGPRECIIHKMSYQEKLDIINELKDTNNRFLEYTQEDVTYRLVTHSGSRDFRLFNDEEDVETFVYVNKILSNDGEEYIIMVNAQAIPFNSVISTSRMVLAIITMFAFVFAFLLLIFISGIISDPIEQINKKAKILAQGRFDVDFNAKGYKEINELSETMTLTAKELSNLEKLRREFIANVSHDLRTPLTMISGYAEVMRDIPGENTAENAQVIINETHRLSDMVSDVLSISKIQAGVIKPNAESYDITSNLRQISKNMAEMLKSEGFKITFNSDRDIIVQADQTMINRSFYNLLANAVNYSGDSREIIVNQIIRKNYVRIEVIDFGRGISEDTLPYIWERYYKDSDNHIENIKSSGLGLSIVKTFVEAHGGSCGVVSSIGKGSTFWFEINL
ncbi:MAG: HAMP domain-containing histidine kinase [Oscillospiraceae bacterium]|nr:HAMP domain-containing histidine kinase [Oscillospiraceae bacterium]